MGFFSPSPGYVPTPRERWQMQQAELKDQKARRAAEAKEAQRIRQQMVKDELKAREERRKIAERAAAEADKEAAEEERKLLTKPVVKRTGGTDSSSEPIVVWHHRCEPPADMSVKKRRRGMGAILVLPKGGGYSAKDAAITFLRERNPGIDQQHPEFIDAHKSALAEMRGYPVITKLCDDKVMGRIFHAAGATSDTRRDEPVAGTYSVHQRPTTYRHVPALKEVVLGAAGLELVYRHHLGDSAASWNKGEKKEALRAAFRSLGVDAGGMEITDTDAGDIRIRFHDKDPLSEPLEQIIHPFDAERGRSYLGKAADGSDIYLTIKNNSCVIVAGMQGGGKTAALMPVLAGMAGHVELHVLDGGASGEWQVLQSLCASYDDSGEPYPCGELMSTLLDARTERMARIAKAGNGAINFWDIPAAQREAAGLYPIVVVIEEAPQYMAKAQDSKEDREIAESNRGRVSKVVKLMRKAGVTLFIIAQKPTGDEIPTVTRDMGAQRLAFRLDSDVAAATVLGDAAYVEPKPTSIPPGKPGRFVARVDSRGSVLGQAVYVPITEIHSQLTNAKPVPRQAHPEPEGSSATRPQAQGAGATAQPVVAAQMTPEEKEAEIRKIAQARGWLPVEPEGSSATRPPEPTPPAAVAAVLGDSELLAALAEAQRRGLIPNPAQPAPEPTGGFDL